MIFDCVAMIVERQKHQSLYARGKLAKVDCRLSTPRAQQNWLLFCTIAARFVECIHAMCYLSMNI